MSCEDCIYFDEHPFIREDDHNDYCNLTGKVADPYGFCEKYIYKKWDV